MRVSVPSVTFAALSAATILLAAAPLGAAPQQSQIPTAPATTAHTPPTAPTGPGGATTGHPLLSTGDCTHVGGTVVVVGDNRCGSTRRYCRMDDGTVACIETVDKPG